MFLGHFAVGPALKPLAPKVPLWVLIVAPQFLDVFFIIFMLLGIEGLQPDGKMDVYGQFKGDIMYTHSLVGALLISGLAFWIGKHFWETNRAGWILAGLSFSHWPIDVLVHYSDMPILPGNLGDLPMLGFALWNYPIAILVTEGVMAAAGWGMYLFWAKQQRGAGRWYLGPAIVAMLFVVVLAMSASQLP